MRSVRWIMIRSVFRVVEYVLGPGGYPLSHEWTLYAFDAVLIFIVMVVFSLWHPGYLREAREKADAEIEPEMGSKLHATKLRV